MKRPYDGGAAFPNDWSGEEGMSLRDYFAGQALAGMLAANWRLMPNKTEAASAAYDYADAMIHESEKERDLP